MLLIFNSIFHQLTKRAIEGAMIASYEPGRELVRYRNYSECY